MPSSKIDVHVRRTIVRGEPLKTVVHLPQLLFNVDIFAAQFAELAKLSADRHLPHVAERLAPMTASGTPQEPARRAQRVVETLTARGVDTSLAYRGRRSMRSLMCWPIRARSGRCADTSRTRQRPLDL
jgi:hypothetical protein